MGTSFWIVPLGLCLLGRHVNSQGGLACTATDVYGVSQPNGICFDSNFAQAQCAAFGATVAPFGTCATGFSCCYVGGGVNPSLTTTTFNPLNPGGTGNVCGVSLQNRLNPGLGGGITPAPSVDPFGVINPRDTDKPPLRFSRILGGTPVTDMTRYCWIAAIYAGNTYIASGAIINANWIITSGNAVKNYRNVNPNPFVTSQTLTVRLGQTSSAASTGTAYPVQSVQLHPSFRLMGAGYPVADVALLQIQTGIDFNANPTLCGACLPDPTVSVVGERCHAAGYGVTAENTAVTDGQLRAVLLPFIPRPVCDLIYRQILRTPNYVTDATSLCAGGEAGKDTCLKDGGAPLSCISVARPYYVVAGLSSWGNGCGRSGTPSVYADLSNQQTLTWIRTTAGLSFPAPTGIVG
ncbi:putative Serine protease 38 [Hypsibius exemplaris]|uniref:Serine protease 38 n=1 Tax=Hypsibius exemplaris TaxID=2072580 RepID=A0A1W0WE30_HYPEX|nr:putative Serine protease 38 [Hypsibius exemplaris]